MNPNTGNLTAIATIRQYLYDGAKVPVKLKDDLLFGAIVNIFDAQKTLLECVNGNGKPGLKSDVRSLQDDMHDVKDAQESNKNFGRSVILLAIGEAITLIGTVAILILKR
jgi:hypothetical protein